MDEKAKFQHIRRLEEFEVKLVKGALRAPERLKPAEEAIVRTAISLAKLHTLQHDRRDIDVFSFLANFREDVDRRLASCLQDGLPPDTDALLSQLTHFRENTLKTQSALMEHLRSQVPQDAIEEEIRRKALVLALGGGGGTGYVYVGVMAALEESGIRPSLLAGTSIGAILALFRSRIPHFEKTELINIVRGLSWRKLFRTLSTDSRYGLPAPLRLYLRAGIGRFFTQGEAHEPRVLLSELPVPIMVSVSGIRGNLLPHPVSFYEKLLQLSAPSLAHPLGLGHSLWRAFSAIRELVTLPDVLVPLHLGATAETSDFDALDATGFSCSLPGVIHYDVLRPDTRMHELLESMMRKEGISRLVDGGLTNNVPAKAAWESLHQGKIGKRNGLVVALNGFSLKFSTPLWLPLQQLADLTASPNRPFAHLFKDFKKTLSPLELVPSVDTMSRAITLGREQIAEDMPFIVRMLTPLPRLSTVVL